jgi:hypothetical protein
VLVLESVLSVETLPDDEDAEPLEFELVLAHAERISVAKTTRVNKTFFMFISIFLSKRLATRQFRVQTVRWLSSCALRNVSKPRTVAKRVSLRFFTVTQLSFSSHFLKCPVARARYRNAFFRASTLRLQSPQTPARTFPSPGLLQCNRSVLELWRS